MRRWALSVLLLGTTASCVGGPPEGHAEREQLAAYVVDQVPGDMGKPLDIDFDGKVTLLGAKVEPKGPLRPGQRVKLTLFWQVKGRVGAGWNLFTHLLDGAGERIANLDNIGPLRQWRGERQVFGPWAWEPGKVYIDEQEFTLPTPIHTKKVQLVVGLWKGEDRLPIRRGPHDRHDRAIVAEPDISGLGPVPPPQQTVLNTRVPSMRVDKLPKGAKLVIDGRLDEPEWRRAGLTGSFRNVATGQRNLRRDLGGNARLLWDDEALYVGIKVDDHDITGNFEPQARDPHLWTQDTAEIMIDPDGDGDNRDYYEIQIGPQNLVFDTRFDTYNQPVERPNGPFGHQGWSAKLKSAVKLNGTLNDSSDRDTGYVVEARIPWSSFDKAQHSPPRVGDEWRMNFYAMAKNDGMAWSPILRQGNFHKASRFGRVVWAEKGWVAPGAAPSASGSAALGTASASASPRPPRSAKPRLKLAPRTPQQ